MRNFYRYIPVIIVASIIFFFSSLEGSTVHSIGLQKNIYHVNGHFFLFLALGICAYKAVKDASNAIFWSFIYAITDEFHQLFTPGRAWQFSDLVVDLIGIVLGVLFVWSFQAYLPNKLKNWLLK